MYLMFTHWLSYLSSEFDSADPLRDIAGVGQRVSGLNLDTRTLIEGLRSDLKLDIL